MRDQTVRSVRLIVDGFTLLLVGRQLNTAIACPVRPLTLQVPWNVVRASVSVGLLQMSWDDTHNPWVRRHIE